MRKVLQGFVVLFVAAAGLFALGPGVACGPGVTVVRVHGAHLPSGASGSVTVRTERGLAPDGGVRVGL